MSNNKRKWKSLLILTGIGLLIIPLFSITQSSKPKAEKTDTEVAKKKARSRYLSGIFKLPADGRIVSQDVNGKELQYNELEYVRFQQLGSPGKFTVVNRKPLHSNWTTDRQTVTSSRTKYSDKVRLMSADGKPKTIQVRIIPRRS